MAKSNDLQVAEEIGGLRKDVQYIVKTIDEIKSDIAKRDTTSLACKTAFEKRIAKLEDTEKRVKIYIAVAVAIGGAIMFIVDKAINYFIALKTK